MKKLFGPSRSRAASVLAGLRPLLLHLWEVFSSPSPSGRDLLTLLSLCLGVAVATGLLLHRWLSGTLGYRQQASLQTACVHSASLFLVSALFHPLRCVLTLTLPTVCTKQGRRLLLSASIMVLVLNVLPNISLNIGAATRVLKCTAEGFTRTLLNSSHPLNQVKEDLVEEVIRAKREELSVVTTLRTFNQVTRVDVSEVKSRFAEIVAEIELNFLQVTSVLKDYRLISNRVLAAVFVALLLVESGRYLKAFLTTVRFQDRDVLEKAACGVTSRESASSFLSLVVVTCGHASMVLLLLLDYVVYRLLQILVPWFRDFPPTSAVISVDYTVQWFSPVVCLLPQSCRSRELSGFHRKYQWDFSPEPALCDVTASPPHPGVPLLLGFLWVLSYLLVFLEVYAKRLRRSIAASFFREEEEEEQEEEEQ